MAVANIVSFMVSKSHVCYQLEGARHAANEYGGLVNIVIWFRLSHKPRGLASFERVTV